MELDRFNGAVYDGTRRFAQRDAATTKGTGFTAGADDYAERGIDLNEQLVRNKPATFFLRVNGDSMQNAGIHSGDVVIVDRSLKPVSGKIVIVTLNGEMLIRRLEISFGKLRLIPETSRLAPIDVDPSGAEFSIWGVVTYVIHAV